MRVEDEAVRAGIEVVAEPGAAVVVGPTLRDEHVAAVEDDQHPRRGLAGAGVQDVRRQRGHGRI